MALKFPKGVSMKNKAITAVLAVVMIAMLSLSLFGCGSDNNDVEPDPTTTYATTTSDQTEAETTTAHETEPDLAPENTTTAQAPTVTTTTTAVAPGGFVYPFNFPGVAPVMANIPSGDAFYLILVNRNFALPDHFTRDHLNLVTIPGSNPAIQMHATAAHYYHQMYLAGRQAGVGLIPFSGYRNTQRQYTNFTNRIQRYRNQGYTHEQAVNMAAAWIKPPRCSEHETGLAIDITNPGHWGLRQAFDQTPEFAWLMENAHEFGFIMRYPRGAEAITMVNYEPWHFRFVGVENARAIHASGLVLEQWLEQRS